MEYHSFDGRLRRPQIRPTTAEQERHRMAIRYAVTITLVVAVIIAVGYLSHLDMVAQSATINY